jgi:hypothetical protein
VETPTPVLELPAINLDNARFVLVGSDSETLGQITNLLPPGSATTRFDEPYQALAGLTDDPQDVLLVALNTDDLEKYLELFSEVRVNPRLYNLPVGMVSDGKLADLNPPYAAGATVVFQVDEEFPPRIRELLTRRLEIRMQRAVLYESLQLLG